MVTPGAARSLGTVRSFDDHVGLGEVEADDGRVLMFHCVGIADGTRTIAVGTRVDFAEIVKFGRVEATDLLVC